MGVNSSKNKPSGPATIQQRLNEIYSPAIVSWNVEDGGNVDVTGLSADGFKTSGLSLFSRYTSDMNRVIDAYNAKLDKNTLVLFFVEASDGDKLGYMPLTGNYGFIFNLGSNVELLAHELAHGAFNLRHTFSSKSFWREKGAAPVFPEKSTPNLLDYAGGTELWKYQWDLIHDPESILLGFMQDESEGAAMGDVKSQLLAILNNSGNNAFLFLKKCEAPPADQEIIVRILNQPYKTVVGRINPNGTLELIDASVTNLSIQTKFTELDNIPTNEDAFFILGRGNAGIVCVPDDQIRYNNYCATTGASKSEEFLSKWAEDISKCHQPRIYNFSSEKDIPNQAYIESLLGGESIKDDPTGQYHTLKGWLVLTDGTTTSEDYATAQSLAPPTGEVKIWLHKTDEGWELKSELPQTINEFKNLEDKQGSKIYDMAKFAGGLALEAVDIVATAYYEIYDATAKGVRKLRIPNYAWDDTDPEYSRMYAYVYKFVLTGIDPVRNVITYAASETLANEIQTQAPQVAAVLRKFGDGRIEFAFMCGVWNGAVETVASVPDLLKLLVAPMSSKGRDDFSKMYTSLRDFKLEENGKVIDSGVWCAISTGFKQQFNTDLKIAEGTGEMAFVVALCFIDPAAIESAGAKTFAQVIKVLQKLDSFSETLNPATYAIRFTKDLTGKLLNNTRNRVCAVIKEGVLKAKAISSKGKIIKEFNEKLDDIALKAENGEIKALKGGETYDLLDDMPGYELKESAGYGVYSKVSTDANGKYTERIYALKAGDEASISKFFDELETNALAKNATDVEIIGEAIANPTFKENKAIFERWDYKFETVTENGEEVIKLTKKITQNAADAVIDAFKKETGIAIIKSSDNTILSKVKSWQGGGVYTGVDEWYIVEIPKGTKIYGGLPGQSEFYSVEKTITDVNYDKIEYWKSLQVQENPTFGYRPKVGTYEVQETIKVAIAKTTANPQFGSGGAWQVFVDDFTNKLKLVNEIPLK
ncbi:MAG: hypothetical protein QM786_00410 [Breznakibacter sp.]